MRLWSLHPKHLDVKGLTALWREALLAQKVLQGETRGYRRHPQLERFKSHPDPLAAIATYLEAVQQEADGRGYHFDTRKINPQRTALPISVTQGQIDYEWELLKSKLQRRDTARYEAALEIRDPEVHPLLNVIVGGIEAWERQGLEKGGGSPGLLPRP